MQTAREESSIIIFGETLLKRESAAEQSVCRERVAAGISVPEPITRREAAVDGNSHVRWCERGRKPPTQLRHCDLYSSEKTV